jgi:hypothetical protein
MIGSVIIIVFIIFYFSVLFFYFIIIATSHIEGWSSNSEIYMGKNNNPPTSITININSSVCLEVNTTRLYFINDKHIKKRVVNVPKNVDFGV